MINIILEILLNFSSIIGLISHPLLMGPKSHSVEGLRTSPLEEDNSYLDNLSRLALEEELGTLSWYT